MIRYLGCTILFPLFIIFFLSLRMELKRDVKWHCVFRFIITLWRILSFTWFYIYFYSHLGITFNTAVLSPRHSPSTAYITAFKLRLPATTETINTWRTSYTRVEVNYLSLCKNMAAIREYSAIKGQAGCCVTQHINTWIIEHLHYQMEHPSDHGNKYLSNNWNKINIASYPRESWKHGNGRQQWPTGTWRGCVLQWINKFIMHHITQGTY